jgi:hypothetical protein
MTYSSLNVVQRRVLAIMIVAGEARVENGAIVIPGREELPATIVRQLIGKGWLSRHARAKGCVVIKPAIGAAAKVESARVEQARVDKTPRLLSA